MSAPLIHIGYHKTGTSYLQKRVFSNDAVFFTPWGHQSTAAVEHFVLSHPARFDPDAVRADLLKDLPDGDARIPTVSQEALSGRPIRGNYYSDQVARRIHATFPEARILISIRAQVPMLESLYFQYIRQGGTERIETLINANANRVGFRAVFRLDHLEYDLTIQQYSALFGAENVLVMPLEMLAQTPDAYLDRLSTFLGVDLPTTGGQSKKVNARHSNRVMQLERRLNRWLPRPAERTKNYADLPLSYRARNRLIRVLNRLDSGAKAGVSDPLTRTIETLIGDHFSESNQRTAALTDLNLGALGYHI